MSLSPRKATLESERTSCFDKESIHLYLPRYVLRNHLSSYDACRISKSTLWKYHTRKLSPWLCKNNISREEASLQKEIKKISVLAKVISQGKKNRQGRKNYATRNVSLLSLMLKISNALLPFCCCLSHFPNLKEVCSDEYVFSQLPKSTKTDRFLSMISISRKPDN